MQNFRVALVGCWVGSLRSFIVRLHSHTMAANVDGNGDEAPVFQGVWQRKSMGVLVFLWIRILSLGQHLHVVMNGGTFYMTLQIRRQMGVAIGGLDESGIEVMSQVPHLVTNETNVPMIALWNGGCLRFGDVQSFVHTGISFTGGVIFIVNRVQLLPAIVH